MNNSEYSVVETISAHDLKALIKRVVPDDSPLSDSVQSFVFKLVLLSPCYLFDIDNIESNYEATVLNQDECNEIIAQVKSAHQTDTWAISYMLAEFSNQYREKSYSDKSWGFLSKYLQLMLRIAMRQDKHYKKINKLGVRIRMGLNKSAFQEDILETLYDIHSLSHNVNSHFKAIREYEENKRYEEQAGKAKTTHLTAKIAQIRLAYEVVISNKSFIEKNYKSNKKSEKIRDDQTLNYIDEITRKIRFKVEHKNNNVVASENLADDDPVALLDNNFTPHKKTAKSSQLQQFQVKTNYLHSKRNRFLFASNTRLLKVANYQRLFARLWVLIRQGDFSERRLSTVLLLSMLTGRQISTIIEEISNSNSQRQFLVKEDNGDTSIKNSINVTLNRRGKIKRHKKSYSNNFRLPIPPPLQAVLRFNFVVDKGAVESLLKTLKDDLSLHSLSSQHIESALAFIITHQARQPLHADIMTGVEVEHSSALYYTSIKTASLINTYQAAMILLSAQCFESLKDIYFHKVQNVQPISHPLGPKSLRFWQAHRYSFFVHMPSLLSNSKKKYIGSEMSLKDDKCSKFFKLLTNNVHSYDHSLIRDLKINNDTFIKQFNAYSLWLWHIVQIQTGIRPVNDAPGLLNQFSFSHNLYWVSDKSIRPGEDHGRLIPISDFLKTALKNYIIYIQQFASVHNLIYTEYALPIKKIMQSEVPFLQVFNFKSQEFKPIMPSRIKGMLGNFLYHQDNWLRHQLRSMLTDRLDEVYICALFGHEHADQEIFHPMSSLPISQYKAQLSPQLDHVAEKLGLIQVEVDLHD
ncbi:hypothetical protein [Psychrobacter jeotgali]|uniref:hypothetical protein n=1 Tax=Psychrobacter jeotgali TaxID=179010 RepID=UPI0019189756|nr:hypothetical protein [Psychrobacter jeotgali]